MREKKKKQLCMYVTLSIPGSGLAQTGCPAVMLSDALSVKCSALGEMSLALLSGAHAFKHN